MPGFLGPSAKTYPNPEPAIFSRIDLGLCGARLPPAHSPSSPILWRFSASLAVVPSGFLRGIFANLAPDSPTLQANAQISIWRPRNPAINRHQPRNRHHFHQPCLGASTRHVIFPAQAGDHSLYGTSGYRGIEASPTAEIKCSAVVGNTDSRWLRLGRNVNLPIKVFLSTITTGQMPGAFLTEAPPNCQQSPSPKERIRGSVRLRSAAPPPPFGPMATGS
jgi:hypothetical protein